MSPNFYKAFCMPRTALSTLPAVIHSIPVRTPWNRYHCYTNFTEGEAECREIEKPSGKWCHTITCLPTALNQRVVCRCWKNSGRFIILFRFWTFHLTHISWHPPGNKIKTYNRRVRGQLHGHIALGIVMLYCWMHDIFWAGALDFIFHKMLKTMCSS